jgi:hypothetical protein
MRCGPTAMLDLNDTRVVYWGTLIRFPQCRCGGVVPGAGWSSQVARRVHCPEVARSSRAPATIGGRDAGS